MIGVNERLHRAVFRFGLLPEGAAKRPVSKPFLAEWALPGGEVVARKVVACGEVACWLRSDLAAAAATALEAERIEYDRVVEETCAWMLLRDMERAADAGMDIDTYRRTRNHTLARIDARRGVNSRGL